MKYLEHDAEKWNPVSGDIMLIFLNSRAALVDAVLRAEKGLVDADLGGNLIKQRVARQGRGRSGYRTIIAIRKSDRAIFVYGFAKSARENIAADDLEKLKTLDFYVSD